MTHEIGLSRFKTAQLGTYAQALAELRQGKKRTHWMWFIFPQIIGLGRSVMAATYAIRSRQEAEVFLRDPLLGPRLVDISEILLCIENKSADDIFGSPDDLKLMSCMTLFNQVAGDEKVFSEVLDYYFAGQQDKKTLDILDAMK